MKSIANLSKYLGCYDTWLDIKKRHNLKWTNGNYSDTFSQLLDQGENYDVMIKWLKTCLSKLSKPDANILLYCTLTGLRPTEACQSISLIQTNLISYLNSKTMVLEHFKYPEIFLRRTKKAYLSIITDEILDIAKSSTCRTYNSLRMVIRKHNLDTNLNYCRKIFATHMRNQGIATETIDLLQGRSPQSVFARYYFKPNLQHNHIRNTIGLLLDSVA